MQSIRGGLGCLKEEGCMGCDSLMYILFVVYVYIVCMPSQRHVDAWIDHHAFAIIDDITCDDGAG